MTVELTMLLYSTILIFVFIAIPATVGILDNGVKMMAGARDNIPEPSVFNARGKRLVANMQENLVMFAIVVLLAHAAGISNEATVQGAQIFFYARIGHGICYLAGWPWIRPLFWAAGIVGILQIAIELI